MSIYHNYIETELNTDFCTFAEAVKVKHYTKNECWINALNDFYANDHRMKMTRESVLSLIGKTEDEFTTDGACINEMEKVFVEYRIPARIFDYLGNVFYSYDPPKLNKHIKAFYGMVKDDRIYTLNSMVSTILPSGFAAT